MMFLSEMSFLSYDSLCLDCGITNLGEVNCLRLENGLYANLILCEDYIENIDVPTLTPDQKDELSIKLFCYFEDNCDCGDLDFNPNNLTALAVKRRDWNSYNWTTIDVHEINGSEDFIIQGRDNCPTTGSYEYALVPIKNDYVSGKIIEGKYSRSGKIDVVVNKLTLIDGSSDPDVPNIWSTLITDGYCDVAQNVETSVLTTMYNRYPTVVKNSDVNYSTINVSGEFYPIEYELIADHDENGNVKFDADGNIVYVQNLSRCVIDTTNATDQQRNVWISQFIQFLTNGYPKILKNIDGRAWIISVTGQPSNNADGHYKKRKISFSCVEIGDLSDTELLYRSSLISSSVTKNYW